MGILSPRGTHRMLVDKVASMTHLDDKVEVGQLAEVLILQRPRLRRIGCRQQPMPAQLLHYLCIHLRILRNAVPAKGRQTIT